MATIRDVARHAGVSIASVSAVLNDSGRVGEDTRQRIWAAVETVGYSPSSVARSLRTGRSALIGMAVGNITNPFSAGLVRIVERAALAQGFSVIVCNAEDPDRIMSIINQMRGQQVAGILMAPVCPAEPLIEQLGKRPFPPVVTFDQKIPGLPCDFVGVDNRAAIRMLVDYLVRLGHRRIAMINDRPGSWTSDERHVGFLDAMEEAGLDPDPTLISRTGFASDTAAIATAAFLSRRDRPTAILAANNVTALGALQSCLDLGFHCPQEVSIVGVDDVPWSGLVRPRISIVAQPVEEIGALAIQFLLERIATPEISIAPRERIFQPSIMVGESCRDIRGEAEAARNATVFQERDVHA